MGETTKAMPAPKSEHLRSARDAIAVLVAGLAIWVVIDPGAYDLRILTQTVLFALAAVGLNILVGFGGIVSVGHAVFMAIGGYTWARLADSAGPPAILVAVAIAVVVALILGWMCLRFRGYFLAVATLAFGMIGVVVMRNWNAVTGGDEGIRGIPQVAINGLADNDTLFVVSLVLLVVFLYLQNVFRASPIGNALVATRWNEELAGGVGISIRNARILAFVLSSIPACIAGAFVAQLFHYVNPEMFAVSASINLIAIPIIAGRGWRWAPVVGAAIVIALPEYVRFLQDYRLMVYGAILILIALFLPSGLQGAAVGLRSLISKARRRPPVAEATGGLEGGVR